MCWMQLTLASLSSADLVIEAAPERLELKRALFAELDRVCMPRGILATNSSSIELALTAYIIKLEHLRDNLRTREIESEFEIASALAATLRK